MVWPGQRAGKNLQGIRPRNGGQRQAERLRPVDGERGRAEIATSVAAPKKAAFSTISNEARLVTTISRRAGRCSGAGRRRSACRAHCGGRHPRAPAAPRRRGAEGGGVHARVSALSGWFFSRCAKAAKMACARWAQRGKRRRLRQLVDAFNAAQAAGGAARHGATARQMVAETARREFDMQLQPQARRVRSHRANVARPLRHALGQAEAIGEILCVAGARHHHRIGRVAKDETHGISTATARSTSCVRPLASIFCACSAYSAAWASPNMRRSDTSSSALRSCQAEIALVRRTSTAVTLYSGQLVAQSLFSVVTTLAPVPGWWKVV